MTSFFGTPKLDRGLHLLLSDPLGLTFSHLLNHQQCLFLIFLPLSVNSSSFQFSLYPKFLLLSHEDLHLMLLLLLPLLNETLTFSFLLLEETLLFEVFESLLELLPLQPLLLQSFQSQLFLSSPLEPLYLSELTLLFELSLQSFMLFNQLQPLCFPLPRDPLPCGSLKKNHSLESFGLSFWNQLSWT